MRPNQTPLERAFELARGGKHRTVEEIKKTMKSEGVGTDQISGRMLQKQLRDAMDVAAQPASITSSSALT